VSAQRSDPSVVVDETSLEREAIERMMPHAPSWVQVDRVVECRPPDFIRTQKFIACEDPAVLAHFRDGPALFPGALLIEHVSQSAYLLARLTGEQTTRASMPPAVRVLARCSANFVSPAFAGDLLTTDVRLVEKVGRATMYEGIVSCGDRTVCRARIFGAQLTPRPTTDSPGQ
jgi:3-hydroxymyristoyl/3-hydroxydecanoyl-(acyl carrier protein) dehydratase